MDATTDGLQIACDAFVVEQGEIVGTLERCIESPDGTFEWPSADVDLCWFAFLNDAVSAQCIAEREGFPAAEIGLLRRPTSTAEPTLRIVCEHPPQCPGYAPDSE